MSETIVIYSENHSIKRSTTVSVLGLFVTIGLVRLTNLNYYLSQLAGFETTVDELGGGAFNFMNYAGVLLLILTLLGLSKRFSFSLHHAWPFAILALIYTSSLFTGPYTNPTWVLYQNIFIAISFIVFIISGSSSLDINQSFKRCLAFVYLGCMGFVLFALIQILIQQPLSYFFVEYNDAFVQSLDDFGIMKQRFGYLAGFLFAYTLFVVKHPLAKVCGLILILFTCFGIRSFMVGLIGSLLIFTIRSRWMLMFWTIGALAFFYALVTGHLQSLLYDTRYYSFLNGYDIVSTFPFGVGLGGYPIYTEEFSSSLFSQLYNVNAILDFVPTAPESDLVHIFGSLGLTFGLIHMLIIGRIIWYSLRFQKHFTNLETCFIFYFAFMTFFGISEDSIFSINYWIFFGLALGIIYRVYQNRFSSL